MNVHHLAAIILLYSTYSVLAQLVNSSNGSYEELNISCKLKTCTERDDSDDTLTKYNCNCDAFCSEVGTCCIDSPYIHSTVVTQRRVCRTVDEDMKGYFLTDRCPTGDSSENALKSLCEDKWNGEDNATLLIPVTSLLTNKTYKNYFCFRCHEDSNEYRIWSILLIYESDINIRSKIRSNIRSVLSYSRINETWVITDRAESFSIPVSLRYQVPKEISRLQKTCIPELITECSANCTDEGIKNKCKAYMYVTQIKKHGFMFKYRNPHCALCNFEDLSKITCKNDTVYDRLPPTFPSFSGDSAYDSPKPSAGYRPRPSLFPLSILVDINFLDGNIVGKVQRCNDNYLWDPFYKECKRPECALPGYVLQGEKCKRL